MSGLAHVITRYEYSNDAFPQGLPSSLWTASGVKLYDPRQDSTYPGGSGAHRVDQPSTWTYSENPFLAALQWTLGRYENGHRVYGIGAKWAEVDVASFVTGANVADANGWKVGGVVTTDDDKYAVLASLLAAGGGVPVARGAQIACTVNAPKTSVLTLTREDIVGEVETSSTTSWRDRQNTIIPKYREETQGWEIVAGEQISSPVYIEEDGGEQKTVEVEFPLVQQAAQAHQLATYELCNSREFLTFTVNAKLRLLAVRVGDAITVNVPQIAAKNIKCTITGREFNPSDMSVTLSLKSETDAKHAFALGQSQVAPPAPKLDGYDPSNPGAPAANAWAITDTQIKKDDTTLPVIVVTGATDDPNTSTVIVEYRPTGSDTWLNYGEFPRTTTKVEISGLTDGTAYDVALSYRTVLGVVGERLVLNATAGAFKVSWASTVNGPGKPADNATVGAPVGTEVGGRPVSQLIGDVDDAKGNAQTAVDALKNTAGVIVPVRDMLASERATTNAAVADAKKAGTDAQAALAQARTDLDGAIAGAKAEGTAARQEAAQVRTDLTTSVNTVRDEAAKAQTDANTARTDLASEVSRAKGEESAIRSTVASVKQTADGAAASISDEITARADGDRAISNRLQTVEADYTTKAQVDSRATVIANAKVAEEATTRANADSAITSTTSALTASFGKLSQVANNDQFAADNLLWDDLPAGQIVTTSGGRNNVLRTTVGQKITPVGRKVYVTSDTQRFKLRCGWRLASGTRATFYMGVVFFNADGNPIYGSDGTGNYPLAPGIYVTSPNYDWFDREITIGRNLFEASPYGGTRNIPAGTAYFRQIMFLNYVSEPDAVVEVDYFTIDDVTDVAATKALVQDEATARAGADSALGNRVSSTEAKLSGGEDSWLAARVRDEATASANRDSAISGRTSTLETSVSYIPETWRVCAFGNAAEGANRNAGLFRPNGSQVGIAERSYGVIAFAPGSNNATLTMTFDVYGEGSSNGRGSASMAANLNSIPNGWTVIIYTCDEPKSNRFNNGLGDAMARCGAGEAFYSNRFYEHSAYVLIGRAGIGRGNGTEYFAGGYNQDPNAYLDIPFILKDGRAVVGSNGTNALSTKLSDEQTSRSDADTALGNRITSTEAKLNGGEDSWLAARVRDEATASVNRDSAITSRANTLESAVGAANNSLNPNPNFTVWPDGQELPKGMTWWNKGSTTANRVSTTLGRGGYGLRLDSVEGQESGLGWDNIYNTPGWYVLEADVWLQSGPWKGSGLTLGGAYNLDFYRDPDTNGGVGETSYGGVRRFSKLIKLTDSVYRTFHPMNHWDGFSADRFAKSMLWLRAAFRAASDGEIIAQKASVDVSNAQARITDEATTRARDDGALSNRISSTEAKLNGGEDSWLAARVRDEAAASANRDGALSTRLNTTEAQFNGTADSALKRLIDKNRSNLIDTGWWRQGAAIPWPLNGGQRNEIVNFPHGPNFAGIPLADGSSGDAWLCQADGSGAAAGGWSGGPILPLDPDRTYRFVVPIAQLGGEVGRNAYWGTNNVCDLNTTNENGNPYFAIHGNMTLNRWHLFVGYLFPRNSTGKTHDGAGVFDMVTGEKVAAGWNYCFTPSGAQPLHRAYQFYSVNGAYQAFGRPMVEEVNGSESPILTTLATARGVTAANALINSEATTRANQDSALAGRIETTEAKLSGGQDSWLAARIRDEATASANRDSAISGRTSTLEATSGRLNDIANKTFLGFETTFDGWGYDTENRSRNSGAPWEPNHSKGAGISFQPGFGSWLYMDPAGWIKTSPGKRYRAGFWIWQWSAPNGYGGNARVYWEGHNKEHNNGAYLGSTQDPPEATNSFYTPVKDGSWQCYASDILVDDAMVSGVNSYWIRPRINIDYAPANAGYVIAGWFFREVTGEWSNAAKISDEATTRSNQDSALAGRISTTESKLNGGEDSWLAARIRDEATASSNRDSALGNRVAVTEARSIGGGNFLNNTDFYSKAGWNLDDNALGMTDYTTQKDNYWNPRGETVLYMSRGGTPPGGTYAQVTSQPFAVTPNSFMQFYAITASHRCRAWTSLFYYDENGAWAGYAGENHAARYNNGGPDLNGWDQTGLKSVQVPANARSARFAWRVYTTGEENPVAWFYHPYAGAAREGQTEWNAFSQGSGKSVTVETNARITDEATASANRDSALGNRITSTEAKLNGGEDSWLAARIRDEATASANRDSANASRTSVLEANAGATANTLNQNPKFSMWSDPAQIPNGWSWWSSSSTFSRYATNNSSGGYAFRHQTPDNLSTGLMQGGCRINPGWYVMEADIELLDGNLQGAGLTIQGVYNLNFASEPDVNGDVGAGGFRRRRFSKIVKVEGTYENWHAMTNWGGFGAQVYKYVDWYYCGVRAASDAEIKAQKVIDANVMARVTTTEGAVATLNGKTEAYFEKVASVPGADAFITAKAKNDNGVATSNVAIGGTSIALYNTENGAAKRAMFLSGGNAVFDGSITATTGIIVGTGKLKVQIAATDYAVVHDQYVSFGYDLGRAPSVTFGPCPVGLNTGEVYAPYAAELSSTGFRAKLLINAAPQSTAQSTGAFANQGGNIYQVSKGGRPNAANGQYTFVINLSANGYAYSDNGDYR
ncbi:hypothetical protein AV944_06735 [Sphingomonas sp. LK11]|nr:hypothetical protein AV944_06735 [Sphingomonas sp. LK11]